MYILSKLVTYLKFYNKYYYDISIVESLSSEEMFKFSDIAEIQGQCKCVTEKNVSDGKEVAENINGRSETEFALFEDPLNMHITASNGTTPVSEIRNITNDEDVIIAPGQIKNQLSTFSNKFCEKKAFPYLIPKGKFGYNAP